MAGRIRDEDIALVRERTSIAEVISDTVTLRSAGGGNLKGLCPFHDEKSPSFNVSPARNVWYCFGCGAGGDAIKFLMDAEHLSFVESVERLAARAGIQLRYVENDQATPRAARSSPLGRPIRKVSREDLNDAAMRRDALASDRGAPYVTDHINGAPVFKTGLRSAHPTKGGTLKLGCT